MPRVKKEVIKKVIKKSNSLSVPVYSLKGISAGTMVLPKEIFGQKVNKKLLEQAMRVYETNQKTHFAKTKTRGQVKGTNAKAWNQKGTGRARHGAKTAPIFVGGGIVFGPKPRKVRLTLPQKMKKAALVSALSSKMADKQILGLSGLEKATGKTKEMIKLLEKLSVKNGLIITDQKEVMRAVRNIPGINVFLSNQINAYEIIRHKFLLLTKEAIESFKK